MSKHPRELVAYISIIRMKIGKSCKPIKCNTYYHFSLPLVLISNFTSSSRYQKICVIGVENLFCISVLYLSVLRLCLRGQEKIMEKTNMRSYSDVVSGSGKFIFGVSARYLCGLYCNYLSAILPNHVQSFISLRVIGLRVRVRVVVQVSSLLTILVFVTFCE